MKQFLFDLARYFLPNLLVFTFSLSWIGYLTLGGMIAANGIVSGAASK